MHSETSRTSGILSALGAYVLWGFLPVYWKLLQGLNAGAILAHRILWALIFTLLILIPLKQLPLARDLLKVRKNRLLVAGAALMISLNWGVYIWAVNAGMVVETSFGYYINPLISVFLGVVVLGEKLSRLQVAALGLAALGVGIMGVFHGSFPWVALTLALSFGLYGLLKKMIPAPALVSLHLETLAALPLAVLLFLQAGEGANPTITGPWGWILVLAAGPLTAVPLLLFGIAARRIPLSTIGFLQYLSPTIGLLLGVFAFGEPFSPSQLGAFGLIWMALALFTTDQWRKRK